MIVVQTYFKQDSLHLFFIFWNAFLGKNPFCHWPKLFLHLRKVALAVKNLPPNAKDMREAGPIPGSGRSPGGGHGNHSSILAWRIPWTEESGGLQSIGLQRVGHDWRDLACAHALNTLFFKLFVYEFIWLLWVLVAACWIFDLHCSVWDL